MLRRNSREIFVKVLRLPLDQFLLSNLDDLFEVRGIARCFHDGSLIDELGYNSNCYGIFQVIFKVQWIWNTVTGRQTLIVYHSPFA